MVRHPPTDRQGPTAPRFLLVDSFRFLCAGWVMWVHIPESDDLAPSANWMRFRLPFFVLLAVFFQQYHLARRPAENFPQYAAERTRRLYVPFLAWGVLYYLVGGVHRLMTGRPWPAITPDFLLHGASIHLWFIPFVFLLGLATYPLSRALLQRRQWAWTVIVAGAVLGVAGSLAAPLIIAHSMPGTSSTDPAYREVELLPCVPLGFACFFLYTELRVLSPRAKRLLHGLAVVLVLAGCLADFWLYRGALVQNLVAVCMVVLTLRPTTWAVWKVLGRWGKYSFGMYAVHILFVEVMHALRGPVFHLTPTWWFDLLSLAVCVPASLLTTMLLCRYSATRWMVPTGEKRAIGQKLAEPVPAVAVLQRA